MYEDGDTTQVGSPFGSLLFFKTAYMRSSTKSAGKDLVNSKSSGIVMWQ